MASLPYPVIDLYIRAFVNGRQPYSKHRYLIDLRPNTPGHLWLGFALSPKGQLQVHTADFSVLCQLRKIRSASSNAVSREAFQGVTPSFHFSEYQLERLWPFRHFYLFAGESHAEFICDNVSLHCQRGQGERRRKSRCFLLSCRWPACISYIA